MLWDQHQHIVSAAERRKLNPKRKLHVMLSSMTDDVEDTETEPWMRFPATLVNVGGCVPGRLLSLLLLVIRVVLSRRFATTDTGSFEVGMRRSLFCPGRIYRPKTQEEGVRAVGPFPTVYSASFTPLP